MGTSEGANGERRLAANSARRPGDADAGRFGATSAGKIKKVRFSILFCTLPGTTLFYSSIQHIFNARMSYAQVLTFVPSLHFPVPVCAFWLAGLLAHRFTRGGQHVG